MEILIELHRLSINIEYRRRIQLTVTMLRWETCVSIWSEYDFIFSVERISNRTALNSDSYLITHKRVVLIVWLCHLNVSNFRFGTVHF